MNCDLNMDPDSILDSLVEGIHVVDPDLRFVYVNDTLLDWLEKLDIDGEIIGRKILKVTPFLSSGVVDEYKRVFETGETLDTREKNDIGGREFTTETKKIPIFKGGNVVNVITVIRDVTREQMILDELSESEARFRSLYENTSIGLYRTSPDGMIMMANPALVRMLGYSSFYELAERNLEDDGFHPSYPREEFKEKLKTDGQIIGLEAAWHRSDGSVLHVRESARAIRDTSGEIIHYEGTVEDITEKKKAEDMLKLINKIMRHDVGNRLGIAHGIMSLMEEGKELDPELVKQAHRSVEKSIGIIKRMTELEKVLTRPVEMKEMDLGKIARELGEDFDIDVIVHGECRAKADEAIGSVIENLIMNSVLHGEASKVEISLKKEGSRCEMEVSDDGKGIPDEIRDQIFNEGESFGENRGSGLGLFIVKKTIERYGGTIDVDSSEEGGATFRLAVDLGDE